MKKIRAIDFFCGAGGMTCGLENASINVLAGIDNDSTCKGTYELNNPQSRFLCHDITQLSVETLRDQTGIEKDDPNLLFIGCAPCQFWSKINTDKKKSALSKNLLYEFQRFVDYFNPGYVVIENVPGLKNNKNATVRKAFLNFLTSKNYTYKDAIINAHDYGVPQNRKRYLIVATRVDKDVRFPRKALGSYTVRKFIGKNNGFCEIESGYRDPTNFIHTAARLSEKNKARIIKTKKDGGTRLCWKEDPDLQIPAYIGKDHYFKDVYGRMYWDKPSPTITTRFNSISNGRFGHPEEDRAISLREGATLQTFPKNYVFIGQDSVIARHIGNAVPPILARRIGEGIVQNAW